MYETILCGLALFVVVVLAIILCLWWFLPDPKKKSD